MAVALSAREFNQVSRAMHAFLERPVWRGFRKSDLLLHLRMRERGGTGLH